MSDDEDIVQQPKKKRKGGLREIMSDMLNDLPEFDGGDNLEVDDLIDEAFASDDDEEKEGADVAVDEVGAAIDDALEFEDEEEGAVQLSSGTERALSNAALRERHAAIRDTIDRLQNRQKEMTEVGFTLQVPLDIIEPRPLQPNAALIDPSMAELAYSDRARAHEAVRNYIDYSTSDKPPPMGTHAVFDVPECLKDIKIPRFALRYCPEIVPSNTVSTGSIGFDVDLTWLAQRFIGFSHDSRRFAALKIRFEGATILLFSSNGSLVTTGARGPLASFLKYLEFSNFLRRLDAMPCDLNQYKLVNLVCSGSTGFRLNLHAMAAAYPIQMRYEPDRFPGGIWKAGKWVVIGFESGMFILTGFTTWEECCIFWRFVFSRIFWNFKLNQDAATYSSSEYKNAALNDDSLFQSTLKRINRINFDNASLLRAQILNAVRPTPLASSASTSTSTAASKNRKRINENAN